MVDFAYNGEFVLKDGSVVLQDFDQPGWATKDLLDNIQTFTLVPKAIGPWPLLRVHIPSNGKPVWTWRVMRRMNLTDPNQIQEMRIYGIGYKKRGQKPYMMWVVPGGHVEAGTDQPEFAQTIWAGQPPTQT